MAIETGSLLRSDSLKNYTPLGEEGNPVYKWATQIRVAIRRKIGAENISAFAIPQPNEDGDVLDWYAPEPGSVVPWSSATREEQVSAKEQLAVIQNKLSASENISTDTEDKEQSVFKRLLKHVIQFPDDQHVYLVNGKPVLTFWGFINTQSAPQSNPLSLLKIPELATPNLTPPVDSIPVHDNIVETIPVKRRSLWWWLLLPLLLLLLFLLLRGCNDINQLPVIKPFIDINSTPEIPLEIETNPDIYVQNRIPANVDINTVNRSSLIDSAAISELDAPELLPEDILEQGLEPEESILDGLAEPITEPLEENAESLSPEAEPKSEPKAEKANEEENDPANPESNPNSETPPQQPLEIPKSPIPNQSLDFLNGHWRANSGLMDAQGRPVNVEYDFKDGKGNVKIKKNDGTVCSGKVEASMKNSELSFSDTGKIVCPDGKSFQPAKVKCKINDSNQTVCEGSYKNGESFNMDVSKEDVPTKN